MPTDGTSGPPRDRTGRTLAEYPRPSVAVDTALLTVLDPGTDSPALAVLEVRRRDGRGWALPGTFLHEGERLVDAVLRSVRDKAGVAGLRPRQLHVFDDPQRDDRGWVLSVAHVDVVPLARLDSRLVGTTRIVPTDRPGRLPYGHGDIVQQAVRDLRARYAIDADPDRLLATTFTIRELRRVHEAIAGHHRQRDTFRRSVDDQLVGTGEYVNRGPGRPAELFTRAVADPRRA